MSEQTTATLHEWTGEAPPTLHEVYKILDTREVGIIHPDIPLKLGDDDGGTRDIPAGSQLLFDELAKRKQLPANMEATMLCRHAGKIAWTDYLAGDCLILTGDSVWT